jgi:hypothetical protein
MGNRVGEGVRESREGGMDLVTALFLDVRRRWIKLVVKALSASSVVSFALLASRMEAGAEPATREAHGLQPNCELTSRPVQKERARIKENALRQSVLMGSEGWDPICEKELTFKT